MNITTFELAGGSTNIDYLQGTKECDLPFSKVSNVFPSRPAFILFSLHVVSPIFSEKIPAVMVVESFAVCPLLRGIIGQSMC